MIKIVMVDDEECDRYLTRRTIKETDENIKFVEFSGGEEFLEVFFDENLRPKTIGDTPPPIMLLLDINMPRLNGFEILEKLEKLAEDEGFIKEHLVVLMFSSSSHADDVAKSKKFSLVKDYLVKPLTPEKLEKLVKSYYPHLGDEL